jgi:hypothetical protein
VTSSTDIERESGVPIERQLPQRRERQPLVERADRHRALAEEAQGDAPVFAVFRRERDAGRERDVAADDAVAAEHVVLFVEEVHRAAEPLRRPGLLPPKLGEQRARAHPLRERDAVITVRRDHVVVGLEGRDRADADRLLADVQMQKAADLSFGVPARALFFDAADEQHLAEELREALELARRLRGRWQRRTGRGILRSGHVGRGVGHGVAGAV